MPPDNSGQPWNNLRGRVYTWVNMLWRTRMWNAQMDPHVNTVLAPQLRAARNPVLPGLPGTVAFQNWRTSDVWSPMIRNRMPIAANMSDIYRQAPALRSWLRGGYGT